MNSMKNSTNTEVLNVTLTPINFTVDNIYLKVINRDANKKLLETIPYLEFHDLAIIFQYLVKDTEEGIGSVKLPMEFFKGKDINEYFEIAKANTRKLFGTSVRSLKDVLMNMCFDTNDISEEPLDEVFQLDGPSDMYVITNRKGINGANLLLYPDIFRKLAKQLNSDLIVLPSSIHEILVVPDFNSNPEELEKMVQEINVSCVADEEVLSNNIFKYKRSTDKIETA